MKDNNRFNTISNANGTSFLVEVATEKYFTRPAP